MILSKTKDYLFIDNRAYPISDVTFICDVEAGNATIYIHEDISELSQNKPYKTTPIVIGPENIDESSVVDVPSLCTYLHTLISSNVSLTYPIDDEVKGIINTPITIDVLSNDPSTGSYYIVDESSVVGGIVDSVAPNKITTTTIFTPDADVTLGSFKYSLYDASDNFLGEAKVDIVFSDPANNPKIDHITVGNAATSYIKALGSVGAYIRFEVDNNSTGVWDYSSSWLVNIPANQYNYPTVEIEDGDTVRVGTSDDNSGTNANYVTWLIPDSTVSITDNSDYTALELTYTTNFGNNAKDKKILIEYFNKDNVRVGEETINALSSGTHVIDLTKFGISEREAFRVQFTAFDEVVKERYPSSTYQAALIPEISEILGGTGVTPIINATGSLGDFIKFAIDNGSTGIDDYESNYTANTETIAIHAAGGESILNGDTIKVSVAKDNQGEDEVTLSWLIPDTTLSISDYSDYSSLTVDYVVTVDEKATIASHTFRVLDADGLELDSQVITDNLGSITLDLITLGVLQNGAFSLEFVASDDKVTQPNPTIFNTSFPVPALSLSEGDTVLEKTLDFSGSSSGCVTDVIKRYSWDILDTDGVTVLASGTTNLVTYVFESQGIYYTDITIETACGIVTRRFVVNVDLAAPVASFSVGEGVDASQKILDSASSTDGNCTTPGISTYAWTIYDRDGVSTLNSGTSSTITVDFPATGVYWVMLKITTACGDAITYDKVTITLPTPTATIDISNGSNPYEKVLSFTNSSDNTCPEGSTLTYLYTIYDEDGVTVLDAGTTSSITYEFPSSGEYLIDLEVTSPCGVDQHTIQIIIATPSPTASFTSVADQIDPLLYTFDATSSDDGGCKPTGITAYSWVIKDSSDNIILTGDEVIISVKLPKNDEYTVELTVTTACGSDTDSETISVDIAPTMLVTLDETTAINSTTYPSLDTSGSVANNDTGLVDEFTYTIDDYAGNELLATSKTARGNNITGVPFITGLAENPSINFSGILYNRNKIFETSTKTLLSGDEFISNLSARGFYYGGSKYTDLAALQTAIEADNSTTYTFRQVDSIFQQSTVGTNNGGIYLQYAPYLTSLVGYGQESTRGAFSSSELYTIERVTTLADSGEGSLRAALEKTNPRVIVFDVSGEIVLQSELLVGKTMNNCFVTVAGETAPGPVRVRGHIRVSGNHVVIRHIGFWGPETGSSDRLNALAFIGNSSKIKIQNCLFGLAKRYSLYFYVSDEIADEVENMGNITVQDCIFLYPVDRAKHLGIVSPPSIENSVDKVTLFRNYFAHGDEGAPLITSGYVHIANNIFYNQLSKCIHIKQLGTGTPGAADIEKNILKYGPMSAPTRPIQGARGGDDTNNIFNLTGNDFNGSTDQIAMVHEINQDTVLVDQAITADYSYTAEDTATLADSILPVIGPHPKSRLPYEQTAINDFGGDTGPLNYYLDISEFGGYPTVPTYSDAKELPIAGYQAGLSTLTVLEEFLEELHVNLITVS